MMSLTDVKIVDRVTITAPLGVQFWDVVQNVPVGEGLDVVAFPPDSPARRTTGIANTSGVYVFHQLPGLGQSPRTFVLQVQDPAGRFLPWQFDLLAPQRGLAAFPCGSPLEGPGVPLYPAPTRQGQAGMAVVRAQLMDTLTGGAAAWALIDLHLNGLALARGVSDAAGRAVMFFAYPEPTGFSAGSPPASGGRALVDQVWNISISAAYASTQSANSLPDLCATLGQPPALLWADASQSQALTHLTLQFGQELTVRSGALPGLLITSTGSPV
jgi:hypothetical protein